MNSNKNETVNVCSMHYALYGKYTADNVNQHDS